MRNYLIRIANKQDGFQLCDFHVIFKQYFNTNLKQLYKGKMIDLFKYFDDLFKLQRNIKNNQTYVYSRLYNPNFKLSPNNKANMMNTTNNSTNNTIKKVAIPKHSQFNCNASEFIPSNYVVNPTSASKPMDNSYVWRPKRSTDQINSGINPASMYSGNNSMHMGRSNNIQSNMKYYSYPKQYQRKHKDVKYPFHIYVHTHNNIFQYNILKTQYITQYNI